MITLRLRVVIFTIPNRSLIYPKKGWANIDKKKATDTKVDTWVAL